jgi:uncharacterized membrane protein (UPF0182 family)
MIILPVENSILFIQPVYLKSTSRVTIPELQRIIMSEGRVVVMERSLEDAYNALTASELEVGAGAESSAFPPHRKRGRTRENSVQPRGSTLSPPPG